MKMLLQDRGLKPAEIAIALKNKFPKIDVKYVRKEARGIAINATGIENISQEIEKFLASSHDELQSYINPKKPETQEARKESQEIQETQKPERSNTDMSDKPDKTGTAKDPKAQTRKQRISASMSGITEVIEEAIAEAEALADKTREDAERLAKEMEQKLNAISKKAQEAQKAAAEEALQQVKQIQKDVANQVEQGLQPIGARMEAMESRATSIERLIGDQTKDIKEIYGMLEGAHIALKKKV